MRYGNPGIGGALDQLRAAHCEKSSCCRCIRNTRRARQPPAFDAVAAHLHARAAGCPRCASSRSFHADDGYIKALAQNVNDYWVKHGGPTLVLSFHGRPAAPTLELRRSVSLFLPGDRPLLLAREAAASTPKQWTLAFQSRFGNGDVAAAVYGRRA